MTSKCYKCGYDKFELQVEFTWQGCGTRNYFCKNCGAKQGWWYEKQYEKLQAQEEK